MNKSSQNPIRLKEISLTASVLIFLFILFFYNHIQQFPSHIHAWTQSDRYALSLGFVDNGLDLFHPATYNLHPIYQPDEPLTEEKGITRVDLPLPEYLTAIVMTITGNTNPVVFRLITLLIGFAGLLYFFALMRSLGANFPISLFSTIFVFSSPVFTYYLDGFIPSIPAISVSFAAFYYYWKYLKFNLFRDYILATALLTIAALIRMPFMLPLLAIIAVQFIHNFRNKAVFTREMLTILFLFSIFSAYYTYNQYLGNVYGSLFLDQLMPAHSLKELIHLASQTLTNWQFQYFSLLHYAVILAGLIIFFITIIRKLQIDKILVLLLWVIVITILAGLVYFVALAQQFPVHDYYIIDTFYLPVFLFTMASLSGIHFGQKKIVKYVGYLILFIVASVMLYSSYLTQNVRYTTHGWDRTETTRINFEGSNQLCEEAGIGKDERALVIDAYTFNSPLLLMKRKGYTVLNTSPDEIGKALTYNFDFIAIQNRFLASDVLHNAPRLRDRLIPIANNGKIGLYRYLPEAHSISYAELLGLSKQKSIFNWKKHHPAMVTPDPDKPFFILVDTIISLPASTSMALIFEGEATSKLRESGKLKLVIDLSDNIDKQLFAYYDSFELNPFFIGEEQSVRKIEVTLSVPKPGPNSTRMKVYIWNQDKNFTSYKYLKVDIIQYIHHTF